MNIKTLKELIKDVPDHYTVCYEYDGPETCVDLEVDVLYISQERENIVLLEDKRESITRK